MSSIESNREVEQTMLDRAQGAMVGLALGDALGTTLEFSPKDSYSPLNDMIGGGPFRLNAGEWTDDTSMMLCLADSLLAKGGHDANDQMMRYSAWWKQGYNSVNGTCFDIGNTVVTALESFQCTKVANAGSTDEFTAGNGSLMRLAPIPIFYSLFRSATEQEVIHAATSSSITTHAERRAIEACQIMAWLLYRIFQNTTQTLSKDDLFTQLSNYWSAVDIHSDLLQIVQGSFLIKERKEIRGTGFVVHSIEAALWSFAHSNNFKEGALLAANLGEDSDTTAAIYGQLAGAYYGHHQLPSDWLDKLAWHKHIKEQATMLSTVPSIKSIEEMLARVNGAVQQVKGDLLYQLLYEYDCILREYRWMDFCHRDLVSTDLGASTSDGIYPKRQFLENMSYLEGFQFITAVVRGDRFCDGLWRNFTEDGSLQVWLEQMATFVKNNNK
ncbi:ADP-ribosylglycohydrolase family protein [Vibrio neonatus]|uniref:ADP-ribosylglycohydrolase family protein n=1 Tax=Vibrio neonatus TaxID=278860 RepID=UPI0021C40602|nr:ADP-ribosylglycohydrolase family protein [Vibrio neonatus]